MDDKQLMRNISRDLAEMSREGQSRLMFKDELEAIWLRIGQLRAEVAKARANAQWAREFLLSQPLDLDAVEHWPEFLDFLFPEAESG